MSAPTWNDVKNITFLFAFPDLEGSREIVLFVGLELFFAHHAPAIAPFREENVSLHIGKDLGEVKLLDAWHRFAVYRGAADDEAFRFVGGAGCLDGSLKRCAHDATRRFESGISRKHVVRAVWKRTPDVVVILATEDNGMPGRNRLEALEVKRQVPRQMTITANYVIRRNSDNCRNQHRGQDEV